MDVERFARTIEDDYDFPVPLQYNRYTDPARSEDITQIFFRYSPNNCKSPAKFGAEVSNSAPDDIVKHQTAVALQSLETSWKGEFNLVFYNGSPFEQILQPPVYEIKCSLCGAGAEVVADDVVYRRDLYLIFLLKNISCRCNKQVTLPGANKVFTVAEGAKFPIIGDTERLK